MMSQGEGGGWCFRRQVKILEQASFFGLFVYFVRNERGKILHQQKARFI